MEVEHISEIGYSKWGGMSKNGCDRSMAGRGRNLTESKNEFSKWLRNSQQTVIECSHFMHYTY
jgi:hypothetical protein